MIIFLIIIIVEQHNHFNIYLNIMSKKINYFDSICYRGEIDLLKFRLTELGQYVDHFIIAEFDSNSINSSYLNNKDLFEKWNHKISHVFVTDNSFLTDIKNEFIMLDPYFEDVLMISDTNSVPNLEDKSAFFEKLKFDSFILEHHNFVWNTDYTNTTLSRGTIVTSFSILLTKKKNTEFRFKNKDTENMFKSDLLENGWKFSNFGYDPNYDYQIEELLPAVTVDPSTTYRLIHHNNNIPLPKNIDLLPYFKIGREYSKKHLFLVESEVTSIEDLESEYDSITIINFNSDVNEILCEPISNKTTNNVLFLPSTNLYGDYDFSQFENEYKLNETKRMFSSVFPQEQDIIKIIYKNSIV